MSDLKAAQQQFREQYKVAENTVQNALNAWLDLTVTTAEWSFNATEQNLRYGFELRGQADRAVQDALTTFRAVYLNGLHSWRDYVRNVNNVVSRVTE
jgi:hypothetical protein